MFSLNNHLITNLRKKNDVLGILYNAIKKLSSKSQQLNGIIFLFQTLDMNYDNDI